MKYEPMLYDAGKKMPGVYRGDMRFGPDGSLDAPEMIPAGSVFNDPIGMYPPLNMREHCRAVFIADLPTQRVTTRS